jgi:hypothetical protein
MTVRDEFKFGEYLHQAPEELGRMKHFKSLYLHLDLILSFQLVDVHGVKYVHLQERHLVLGFKVLHMVVVHHQVTILHVLIVPPYYQRLPSLHILLENLL